MTTIDYAKTALVVIDLQPGIADRPTLAPHAGETVVQNARQLIEDFEAYQGFVVLVNVGVTDGQDQLTPNLGERTPDYRQPSPLLNTRLLAEIANYKNAHQITKRQWGAFYGTDLDLQLRRRGIETIVLCGISTNIGVESTARDAFEHNYHQIFIEDAMTASTAIEHQHSLQYIFPRMGQVMSTTTFLEKV